MAGNKPSRWRALVRYGLIAGAVTGLVFGAVSANRSWALARERRFHSECRAARDTENWNELRQLGEQWVAQNPRNADAWLFYADAAQHQGDFSTAATCLTSIPESDPKALPALINLATLQFGTLNRPFDGVKTCEQILGREPRTTAAHQQLIEYYGLTLQRRQLEHQIRFAIESHREPQMAYVYLFLADTMRMANGIESNATWLTAFPDEEVFLVARVLQLPEPENGVKNEQHDDKYSQVDALFERFPLNLELLAYKTDLNIRKGNVDEVMQLLLHLPAEADDDSRFWRAKGWLHLSRDEFPQAKDALQHAIRLYHLDWNARNWLADTLRRESRLEDAQRLHDIVRFARRLRERITSAGISGDVPTDILSDLAELARLCDDQLVYRALDRRLGRN